jgi:hypothetical protein
MGRQAISTKRYKLFLQSRSVSALGTRVDRTLSRLAVVFVPFCAPFDIPHWIRVGA